MDKLTKEQKIEYRKRLREKKVFYLFFIDFAIAIIALMLLLNEKPELQIIGAIIYFVFFGILFIFIYLVTRIQKSVIEDFKQKKILEEKEKAEKLKKEKILEEKEKAEKLKKERAEKFEKEWAIKKQQIELNLERVERERPIAYNSAKDKITVRLVANGNRDYQEIISYSDEGDEVTFKWDCEKEKYGCNVGFLPEKYSSIIEQKHSSYINKIENKNDKFIVYVDILTFDEDEAKAYDTVIVKIFDKTYTYKKQGDVSVGEYAVVEFGSSIETGEILEIKTNDTRNYPFVLKNCSISYPTKIEAVEAREDMMRRESVEKKRML